MQTDWTSVSVSRDLKQLLDLIREQTGLKISNVIEKSVVSFVIENLEALVALGGDSEKIDRAMKTLITVGLEFSELQEVA